MGYEVEEKVNERISAMRQLQSVFSEDGSRPAVRLRNQRLISDEVLRQLERELDLSEARLLTGRMSK